MEQYNPALDPSLPYRWASWLQGEVIQYCSTSDYFMGRTARRDIAEDIVNHTVEENGLTLEEGYDYLHRWEIIYNQGLEDETS